MKNPENFRAGDRSATHSHLNQTHLSVAFERRQKYPGAVSGCSWTRSQWPMQGSPYVRRVVLTEKQVAGICRKNRTRELRQKVRDVFSGRFIFKTIEGAV